ncbi:MAG: trypsin-like peptidase domain-containing protein [Actinomycetota bacterium]|nr:trypsin-like peptidase domain-containing protein [Actinomycetota bacterium]
MRSLRSALVFTILVTALAAACGGANRGSDVAAKNDGKAAAVAPRAAAAANDNFAVIPDVARRLEPSVVTIETPDGLGSGVVWSADGVIVTDAHVVGTNRDVQVDFADGRQVPGTVSAADVVTDLAVVKAERTGLPAARFETTSPALGDLAIAIGSPLGFTNSVTAGVISGESRSIPGSASRSQSLVGLLQTDAAISPGNSGGALVNGDGTVVGIAEAYIPPSEGAVSIGFATPSGTVVNVVKQLLANGTATHANLGVQPATLTPQIQRQLGAKQKTGVVVVDVTPNSPADSAGIKAGDIITSVDGKNLRTAEDLVALVRDHQPGDKVQVVYFRDNTRHTTTVTLAERPNG